VSRTAGTYTGNGVSNAKAVSFQAGFVMIQDLTTGGLFFLTRSGALSQFGGTTASVFGTLRIDAGSTFTVGTTAADANQNGRSYAWVAYS
jgi:hypothetical protein